MVFFLLSDMHEIVLFKLLLLITSTSLGFGLTLGPDLVAQATKNRTGRILSTLIPVSIEDEDENNYGPVVAQLEECPTSKCTCEKNLNINEPVINCKGKRLQNIPVFTPVQKIYHEIDFSYGNYIKTLPNDAFKNLQVKHINLLKNELTADIQPRAFAGLTLYLEGLKIEGNGGIPIPFDKLTNLTNLKRLHVENFQQNSADENAFFENFPRLEELKMCDIHQLKVDETTFAGKLPNLFHLEFSNVYMDTIPVLSLQHLTGLQSLHIKNNNRLTTVHNDSFESLRNLRELILSYNLALENIEIDAFSEISKSLTTLHLGSNNLNPSALRSLSFQNWPQLTHLTLSYNNRLSPLQESVFKNMGSLEYLYLQEVGLKRLDQSLMNGLINILAIQLGYNQIEIIADRTFVNSRKLLELHLTSQSIGDLSTAMEMNPNSFIGVENSLQVLDFTETPIDSDSLWASLESLVELQELKLRKTGVNKIPDSAFLRNTKLRLLDLQENDLSDLPMAAFKGLQHNLNEVLLDKNKLSTISECAFKNFSLLTRIGLRENPLACDCKLVWLHRFLHAKLTDQYMYYKHGYKCSTPTSYADELLYDIPESVLCSNVIEEDCSDLDKTTLKPTDKTVTTKGTTLSPSYRLTLSIPSRTQNTLTIGWTAEPKSSITGYRLWYYPTTDPDFKQRFNKHREDSFHVADNLETGTFYKVCIEAEIDNVLDENGIACQLTQTLGGATSEPRKGDEDNNNRQVMTGVVIASVAAIILLCVGVCAFIRYKYKFQQLQQVPFALSPGMAGAARIQCGDDMMVCTVPNEYVSAQSIALAQQYRHSPRMIHRQFGVDADENPYNPYNRIKIRRNPYENDDEMTDEEVGFNKSQEVLFKPDLGERHSAPSRLDAAELLNEEDRNSRPLPATPTELQETGKTKARSNTLQVKRNRKKDKQIKVQDKRSKGKDKPTKPVKSSQENLDLDSSDENEDRITLGKDPAYSKANKES